MVKREGSLGGIENLFRSSVDRVLTDAGDDPIFEGNLWKPFLDHKKEGTFSNIDEPDSIVSFSGNFIRCFLSFLYFSFNKKIKLKGKSKEWLFKINTFLACEKAKSPHYSGEVDWLLCIFIFHSVGVSVEKWHYKEPDESEAGEKTSGIDKKKMEELFRDKVEVFSSSQR